jgi:heme A synthase
MTLEHFILTLHTYNVYLIWLTFAITGIWGLILYFQKREIIKPWRISMLVALAFAVLQGLLGIYMVIGGHKPGGGTGDYYLHYVYGGIVVLGIPLVWLSFTSNGENRRRDLLIYSIAALVVVAAAIRAWMTGPS